MGSVGVQGGKIKAVKMFGPLGSINLFKGFFQDFRGIIDYPKTVHACDCKLFYPARTCKG